ncbi:plasmid partition protein ParG [Coleofasciculus sp.]|uniref:plasmid partition protein ParG n=1 Tax=Coleofasciculus sp. TaxID=3100458 RepID=UPI0039F85BEE
MSFYIDEETRTRFKLATTAKRTSMNQVLVDMVNGWLESNDPFKQQPPAPEPSTGGRGGRGKIKDG